MPTEEEARMWLETEWRPRVQADGGEIRFASYRDGILTAFAQGECACCGLAKTCLPQFLQQRFARKFSEPVQLKIIQRVPYFRDV